MLSARNPGGLSAYFSSALHYHILGLSLSTFEGDNWLVYVSKLPISPLDFGEEIDTFLNLEKKL